MDKVAYIYRITNMLDGMQYIGVTTDPKRRFAAHCRPAKTTRLLLKNAIHKYGKENFKMDVILQSTQSYCYEMERKLISAYDTIKPNGYNLSAGGMGSLGLIGKINGCHGRTGEKHPNFGKPGYRLGVFHTKETKAKMRESHLGLPKTTETKRKLSEAAKARYQNPEQVEKMRQIALNRTPELLAKMREARTAALRRKKGQV
jgi:group I intron endonuclease